MPDLATSPTIVPIEERVGEWLKRFEDAVMPAGRVTLRLANRGFEEHNLLFVVLGNNFDIWVAGVER